MLGDPGRSLYTSSVDTWVEKTIGGKGVIVRKRGKHWLGGVGGVDLVKGMLKRAGF